MEWVSKSKRVRRILPIVDKFFLEVNNPPAYSCRGTTKNQVFGISFPKRCTDHIKSEYSLWPHYNFVDSAIQYPVVFTVGKCRPSKGSVNHFRAYQTTIWYCCVPVWKFLAKLNVVMKATGITLIENYPILICLNLARCKNR
jgi:hypothetical protein